MTEGPASADEEFFTALKQLRQATLAVSFAVLVRQAAAQKPPLTIRSQRLSDWFGGKAVPADPAVVRFLVEYLQSKLSRDSGYRQRPLSWWLNLRQRASQQRQVGRVGDSPPAIPARSSHRLGLPVDECDPLTLEVHRAIQVPDGGTSTGPLPGYVPRPHDTVLCEAADRLLGGGSSQLVTLVGGSSTGKTRACWELARYLDQQRPGRWRVWHPYDPTRPEAAVADLERVGAYTVVWLNEAQHYLITADPSLGERLAAGLRTLLQDADRAPVLVLATLWPQYWDMLTVRPDARQPDPFAQARELLAGTAVPVADMFTPEQVAGLATAGSDARLRYAAEHAENGRIAQYLAGAPELETRYRTARPAARALIQVAMDARRLGHPLAIPHALLEQAAPGYLDEYDWDGLGEDWLEQALADTARPCKGARGPLTRIRSRPGQPTLDGGPHYRLADYLEETGRIERAGMYPPDVLWQAFTMTITSPGLLHILADQAEQRGRYQHAIWLYQQAADRGDTSGLRELARLREQAGDTAGAEALYWQAADRGDTSGLWKLARLREETGDTAGAEALYWQAAERGDISALETLAQLREQAGDTAGAEALAVQAAGCGYTVMLRLLVALREQAGDTGGAEALRRQGAEAWRRQGAAEAWRRQAADRGDTSALREQAGDTAGAEALSRPAGHPPSVLVRVLIARREQAGDTADAEALAAGYGTHGLNTLARLREKTGNTAGAEALYRQAAERGDTSALEALARLREQAGDAVGADRMRRFGLTGSGGIATGLDFDSPISGCV